MKRIIFTAIATVLISLPLLAGSPKDVKLPPMESAVMDNGLKIFVVRTDEIPMVTMRMMIPAGSARDPKGLEGVAGLTATMLMKGAAGMGAEEIAEAIESVGGSLNTGSNRDGTFIIGDFMSRDFALALEFMSKVVISPDFLETELEREKGIVKAGLLGEKENPSALTSKFFVKSLLGDHPYADPVAGYAESVEKITRKDIAGFHKANFVPDGSILAIVGDVDAKKALKMVEKQFGKWSGKRSGQAAVEPLSQEEGQARRVVVIDKPDATQSQIRIGNIGTSMNTPEFFPLEVSNNILGGGFTSRLMNEIRVNRGLSYGARSRMVKYLSGGYFMISTFTKNGSLRETIDVALAEAGKMRSEMIDDEELEGSKRYISGLFPFELETNSDLCKWIVDIEFFGLGKDFVEKYRSGISAVSAGDVQRVVREYFRTDGNLVVVLTDYESTKDQLEGLGEIEVVRIDDVR
ncbi:MAG: insulinase family protein [Candidatus Krumholzibacteriota bacterium]|nr:insulinase family protein [Candidatus Krumholzibacteriota bacterium]